MVSHEENLVKDLLQLRKILSFERSDEFLLRSCKILYDLIKVKNLGKYRQDLTEIFIENLTVTRISY
jgi:hypothetical protein